MCYPLKLSFVCMICLFFVNFVSGFCPQDTFNSVSARICGRVCINGITFRQCIDPSTIPEDTKTVEVSGESKVFRRGAVQNLPNLNNFTASSVRLTRITPGAFLNLPKLKTVKLNKNYLEEIQWGVFSNSPIEELDLSWNAISLIENQAFSDMPDLKILNLMKNNLTEYKKFWFTGTSALENILLSYNNIESIPDFAFDIFPNLTYCDLGFNKIKDINTAAFDHVKHLTRLDLTRNSLSWVDPYIFQSGIEVDELRLSLNKLSFLSNKLLERGKVKAIFLHPNPWQCPCLRDILRWMGEHNVTLRNTFDDQRLVHNPNNPECSINPNNPKDCLIGYDDGFLEAQNEFFNAVNYSASIWEKPIEKPFSEDLSPLET